ncbi:MAG: hypothetical protein JXR34_06055 [Bacteroidales bacterium]|nr:hypothetical protein [Bacteroidales bacterium]
MRKTSLHIAILLLITVLSPVIIQSFHALSHHHHELFESTDSIKKRFLNENELAVDDDCIILEFKYVAKNLPIESVFVFQRVFQDIDLSTLPTRIWINKKIDTSSNRGPPNSFFIS